MPTDCHRHTIVVIAVLAQTFAVQLLSLLFLYTFSFEVFDAAFDAAIGFLILSLIAAVLHVCWSCVELDLSSSSNVEKAEETIPLNDDASAKRSRAACLWSLAVWVCLFGAQVGLWFAAIVKYAH